MIRLQEVYQADNGVILIRDTSGSLITFLWSEAVVRGLKAAGLSDRQVRAAETEALAEYTSFKQGKRA